MNIDTDHPRETLVRPDFPIEGRRIETWANHYGQELADYYRASRGRSPDVVEWEIFVNNQFVFQKLRERTP